MMDCLNEFLDDTLESATSLHVFISEFTRVPVLSCASGFGVLVSLGNTCFITHTHTMTMGSAAEGLATGRAVALA